LGARHIRVAARTDCFRLTAVGEGDVVERVMSDQTRWFAICLRVGSLRGSVSRSRLRVLDLDEGEIVRVGVDYVWSTPSRRALGTSTRLRG
jgi:hypothetical protein